VEMVFFFFFFLSSMHNKILKYILNGFIYSITSDNPYMKKLKPTVCIML
jgi:hypothetical protein